MKKEIIQHLHSSFEGMAQEQDGVEFWYARDLQVLLEYEEWRNFTKVIGKAKEGCLNAGQAVSDHFVDVNKMSRLRLNPTPNPFPKWEGNLFTVFSNDYQHLNNVSQGVDNH